MSKDKADAKTDPVHQDVDLQGMCRLREVLTREAMHNLNEREREPLPRGAKPLPADIAAGFQKNQDNMEMGVAMAAARDSIPSLLRAAVLTAAVGDKAPRHIKALVENGLAAHMMPFNELAARVLDPTMARYPLPGTAQRPEISRIEDSIKSDQQPLDPKIADKLCDFVAKGGLRGGVKPPGLN